MPCQLLFCISSICPHMMWFIFLSSLSWLYQKCFISHFFFFEKLLHLIMRIDCKQEKQMFYSWKKPFFHFFECEKCLFFSLKSWELKENRSWASYSNLMLEGICQFQFRFITSPFLWVDTLKRLIIAIYVMLHLRFIY